VIVATQSETDCGTSLTNIWCREFFEVLNDLEPVRAAGDGTTPQWFQPTLDEVILTAEGPVTWKFGAKANDVGRPLFN
jgi:hypothetical protein